MTTPNFAQFVVDVIGETPYAELTIGKSVRIFTNFGRYIALRDGEKLTAYDADATPLTDMYQAEFMGRFSGYTMHWVFKAAKDDDESDD